MTQRQRLVRAEGAAQSRSWRAVEASSLPVTPDVEAAGQTEWQT